MRFDLVTLFVEDPHAVADWYREHFGLVTLEETEQFVRLDGGEGAKVAFHVGEPVGNPRHVQLHFEVADVTAESERLADEGVEVVEGPQDKPYGWRVAAVRDPAGHTVEVVEPL